MQELPKSYSWISLLAIICFTYWGYSDQKPAADFMDTNDPAEFSVNNVVNHLKIIAGDVHHVGTEAHRDVQGYLVDELQELGLEPAIQIQRVFTVRSRYAAGTVVENIVARIKGSGDGKALMLLSHYDSAMPHSFGASDDGSGIATILEGLRVYLGKGNTPKNDIIVLFSDAEELGLLGARAFIENHPWINDVGLILNFEARGSGGPGFMLMETNGKNSKMLQEFIRANPSYPTTNSLSYSVYKLLPNDMDTTPFREIADINGFNFAFIDDHFDYHTAQDTYQRLDRSTLAHQADYLMSTLNYFANSDISDLSSDNDRIFVNFPFIGLLHYPFSWNLPLLIIASIIFLALVFMGLRSNKLKPGTIGRGFLPFLIALIGCSLASFLLWKLAMVLHPQYNDIRQGFTYNGYQYIVAFSALGVWLFLLIYSKPFEKYGLADLLIAPITIWLILNAALLIYLPGASFFILPVFMVLVILAIHLFSKSNSLVKASLYVVLSLPLLYMISPTIEAFPVALGLGAMFISTIFLILLLGLTLPILQSLRILNVVKISFGGITILFFLMATVYSGFSKNAKKPNNITFYHNADLNVSYWASYNHKLDDFLDQFLGESPVRGKLPEEANMGNSAIRYHVKTDNRDIPVSEVSILKDTIVGPDRTISLSIVPRRTLHRYRLFAREDLEYSSLTINGTPVKAVDYEADRLVRWKGNYLVNYFMANTDTALNIEIVAKTEVDPSFYLEGISFDLLSNPLFNLEPRSENMMPFAFSIGDAILVKQTVDLAK